MPRIFIQERTTRDDMVKLTIGQAAPYAVGTYFVLFLAAQANAEFIQPGDLLLPLVIAGGVSAAAHLLAWLLTRSPDRAALIAVVVSVTFSTMGYVVTAIAGANAPYLPGGMWIPIVLVTVVAIALTLAIAGATRSFAAVLPAITCVTAALSLFNTAGGAHLLIQRPFPLTLGASGIPAPAVPEGRDLPDIYLIVPDKYASSEVLRAQYGFDNRPFTDFLRARGFAVPPVSRANYVQTFLSLGSMLNLEYLDWLPDSVGLDNPRWADAYQLVENNRLASFLHERGYRFVFLPTAFGVTRQNRYADLQLPDPHDIRPEFVTAWLMTTAAPVFQYLACRVTGCPPAGGGFVPETAFMLDWKFEELAKLTGGSRPQFVLAHLAVPHEPYIYGADCQHRMPFWPERDLGENAPRVRAAYLDQIRCLNEKLSRLITRLQDASEVPPIIIVQGDHGHGLLGRNLPGLDETARWQVEDRVSAFSAFAVPGLPPSALPDTVTPINLLRAVLRHAFSATLPPVENATFWSSYDRPYRLTRVPEQGVAPQNPHHAIRVKSSGRASVDQ